MSLGESLQIGHQEQKDGRFVRGAALLHFSNHILLRGPDRLRSLDIVHGDTRIHEPDIRRAVDHLVRLFRVKERAGEEVGGESVIKLVRRLDGADLVVGQDHFERRDVALEVLDLAASDDGEDVGHLLQNVREGEVEERGAVVAFVGEVLEDGRNVLVALRGRDEIPPVVTLLALGEAGTGARLRSEVPSLRLLARSSRTAETSLSR